MVIVSNGALSLTAIGTEFGDQAPYNLAQLYRAGPYVVNTNRTQGIPASGRIPITSFYGADPSCTTNTTTKTFALTVYGATDSEYSMSYYELPGVVYNSTQIECSFRCFLTTGQTLSSPLIIKVDYSLGGGQTILGPTYGWVDQWTELGRYVGPAAAFRLKLKLNDARTISLTNSQFEITYKY